MTDKIKAIFLHHSVGLGLLEEGQLRLHLQQALPNLVLDDHGYNGEGLRTASGQPLNTSFNIPDDDTTPAGYARLFSQPVTTPPANALSHLLTYDVIIFKSCFPVCAINNAAQLAEYKAAYQTIAQTISQHPAKLFVYFTPPPQTALVTNATEAGYARALAEWLKTEFVAMPASRNLAVFDLYNLLADNKPNSKTFGTLRPDYRRQGLRFWRPTGDSHPNAKANQAIAPELAQFLKATLGNFRTSQKVTQV